MYYHARLDYSDKRKYWCNHTKEEIIRDIMIPFVSGQIIPVDSDKGKVLLNMRNAVELRLYKTEAVLSHEEGRMPTEVWLPSFEDYECTEELVNEIKLMQTHPQLSSLLQKAFAVPEKQVFVIMRFGDKHLDSAYEGVMKPIIEEFGFRALRIDEIQDSGKITDQVLEGIAVSQYILADLSGERPNCYYETGFAHALGKEIIFTIRRQDAIHFDLADYRFIQWDTEAELRQALRERLRNLTNTKAIGPKETQKLDPVAKPYPIDQTVPYNPDAEQARAVERD